MFPHSHDPARPVTLSLRAAVRHVADLAVAFMTLESYTLDDLRPTGDLSAHSRFGAPSADATARPDCLPAPGAATGTERRLGPRRPHRRALSTPVLTRRPGPGTPRKQLCLTPVRALKSPSIPAVPSSRHRAALQDAPH